MVWKRYRTRLCKIYSPLYLKRGKMSQISSFRSPRSGPLHEMGVDCEIRVMRLQGNKMSLFPVPWLQFLSNNTFRMFRREYITTLYMFAYTWCHTFPILSYFYYPMSCKHLPQYNMWNCTCHKITKLSQRYHLIRWCICIIRPHLSIWKWLAVCTSPAWE
jgi:hypothetical protein